MSQPAQPPNPPQQPHGGQPADGNPYAGQQPAQAGNPYAGQQPGAQTGNPYAGQQPGAQTGNPYGGQQPGAPTGNPFAGQGGVPYAPVPPQAPARNNVGLGIAAGIAAALVGALVYGGLMRALADEDGSYTQIGWAALGVGALVGVALGKVGGRNPVLPVLGIPLALAGVFLGQLFGFALIISWWSEAGPDPVGALEVLTSRLGDLVQVWKEEADFMTVVFLGVAGFEGFALARKTAA
ncbi:hypothetical protein [Streptomyces sp. ALB3]|uniref:hypothetical protein n=1 Tax=Streptomyces sp. ALB3 TaxID=3374278 RepID=UPI00379CCBB9